MQLEVEMRAALLLDSSGPKEESPTTVTASVMQWFEKGLQDLANLGRGCRGWNLVLECENLLQDFRLD